MISNLSTQRLPQSISVSLISPYLGPQILIITQVEQRWIYNKWHERKTYSIKRVGSYFGLRRSVWHFLSSGGLCGEDVVSENSGGRGKSVRSWRGFLSFFFPESEPSFKLTAEKEADREDLTIKYKRIIHEWVATHSYLSPLSMCSRSVGGNGSDDNVELSRTFGRSLSLLCPGAEGFFLSRCTGSSFALPSLSLVVWWSVVLLEHLSEGDWGWLDVGVLGPFSGCGGEGGRPFLDRWLDFGLGWWADEELLVGVDVLLEVLAFAAASAALAFFCLLSSAARLDLKVSVLGERLEGWLREREWRWRLRERECLDDEYGLLLRDRADRLKEMTTC